MPKEKARKVKAQEWIILYKGKIKHLEKNLYLDDAIINVRDINSEEK